MKTGESRVARAFALLVRPDGETVRLGKSGPASGESEFDRVLVGDPASRRDDEGWSGNAVDLTWDDRERVLSVQTSVAGFPPVFELRHEGWWGVTTALSLLSEVAGLRLVAEMDSVLDLCRLGFPVKGRTLFRGVELLPAGRRFRLGPDDLRREEGRWEPEDDLRFDSFAEYSSHQVELFGEVMDTLDSEGALLSLSGGLDTRTIFAGLVENDAIPDCYTVSGPRTSLDAVLARRLCRLYGVRHDIIELSGDFLDDLWEHARRASLLSGGVSSLWSAPQTYCYTRLDVPEPHGVVLSGFLGNQVGRGSTEGISTRPVDLSILSEPLRRRAVATEEEEAWYREGIRSDGNFDRRFLIQEENQYASMAGYAIGHAHAIQRSPYSDARLLSAAASMPPPPETGRDWLDPRITEMAKRFVGVGELSFQGPYIAQVGGAVARHPINYGWTASGMPSVRGWLLGARAFAEDVMTVAARRSRVASVLQRLSGLDGFSTHLYADTWIPHLREPFMDALASDEVRSAGLIDAEAAEAAMSSFFDEGRSRLETVIAVVDLIMLTSNFGVQLD